MFVQFNLKRGGQRVATMLMYLSDDVEGGETHFPLVSASLLFDSYYTHIVIVPLRNPHIASFFSVFIFNFLLTKNHYFYHSVETTVSEPQM
jgi:hypothetical protein